MAATEVRTQLYLPGKLHRALKRAARQRGVSMAQLLREAAEEAVRKQALVSMDPLEGLIGAAQGEPTDLAEEHDRYLYGVDRDEP
jgi:hypothetical protein